MVFAQQPKNDYFHCGATEAINALKKDAKVKAIMEKSRAELEAFTQNYIENNYDPQAKGVVYTIPVVFHIIHTGGIENVSDAQVFDAVEMMNLDYSASNSDFGNTISVFQSIAADCQIEFKLAKKDPQGNCTNGITRTYDNSTNTGNGGDQVNAVQAVHGNWQGNEYLNIFVVANCGGAAGYSTYPNPWTGSDMSNGIFILHSYIGSMGTSMPSHKHALSHEAGHWLNLSHCWGDNNNPGNSSSCSIDDHVQDTPICIGVTTCNLGSNSCDDTNDPNNYSSWTTDVVDNVQNIMEYSYCSTMFSEGQKARMWAALNSSAAGRSNLVSGSNLTATGVNAPEVFCSANFSASTIQVCAGETVTFTDHSYFSPTEWAWTFTGGTPAASSSQNPTITYTTPGTYQVSLTSGNGVDSDTEIKSAYITVLPNFGNLPVVEGFESYSTIASTNNKWTTKSNSGSAWEIVSGVGFTGNKCVKISNIGQADGAEDALISTSYDLSNLTGANQVTLSFRTSYKKRQSNNTDALKIYASKDCGVTWDVRKNMNVNLLSVGTQISSWTPTSQSDWVTTHVTNILSNYFTSGFRLKFEFTNGQGNNIYLDDINLYEGGINDDPLSINELANVISDFNIYPNPTVGNLNVMVNIPQAMKFQVNVVDLSGKQLQSHNIHGQPGANNVVLDLNTLAKGMYFVEIISNGAKSTKQFVRQ